MSDEFDLEVTSAVEAIEKAEIILFLSDGLWALACNARNDRAILKTIEISKHFTPFDQCVFFQDDRSLLKFAPNMNPLGLEMIRYSEKPINFVFDDLYGLSPKLLNEQGNISVRIPRNNAFCSELFKRLKKPIFAIEISNINSLKDIPSEVLPQISVVVKSNSNKTPIKPSVIWLGDTGEIKIIQP